MSSIGHMIHKSNSQPNPNPIRRGKSSFQSQILIFVKSLEEAWKRKREAEAEAEAVDGRLKEAEAKEKLTAVASLDKIISYNNFLPLCLRRNSQNPNLLSLPTPSIAKSFYCISKQKQKYM